MQRAFLSCIISLVIITKCFSQSVDDIRQRYRDKTIQTYSGHFRLGINGDILTKSQLKKELNLSPDAAAAYAFYKKNKTAAIIVSSLSTSLLFASVIAGHNAHAGRTLGWAGVGSLLVSVPLRVSAGRHLQRAVWMRNRDILFQP